MIAYRIIERKRDGVELESSEIEGFFRGYLAGSVDDCQVAAFLMAVFFRGLSAGELDALVEVMLRSGTVLDRWDVPGPTVDKHSTGGVGDKVSLVLAPLGAALGLRVPMMSGRGLGHTGGTLDKLEAIPGFRTDLSLAEFRAVLERVGCAMISQTREIAPLDGRLYALRHATGTVPSIPLIAASIMSKKLAEGLDALVLDVKRGSGAFIPEEGRALELARIMVAIGERRGLRTVALLTAMDCPLGRAVGNALEAREAMQCLGGQGPEDLRTLVLALAAEMLLAVGVADSRAAAAAAAARALDDGSAREKCAELVAAQGGDPRVVKDPALLPVGPETAAFRAPRDGVVRCVCPERLGSGVVELGGGRVRPGERIDPRVGFTLEVRPGTPVRGRQVMATAYAGSASGAARGLKILQEAIEVGDEVKGRPLPLISHRVTAAGVEEVATSRV
ncbi:MAG: thymidine phosphorylase [Gemmatimonadetes bacterium]|nr:thymidine phosphorylase [Gemmatimonadota bacterium]